MSGPTRSGRRNAVWRVRTTCCAGLWGLAGSQSRSSPQTRCGRMAKGRVYRLRARGAQSGAVEGLRLKPCRGRGIETHSNVRARIVGSWTGSAVCVEGGIRSTLSPALAYWDGKWAVDEAACDRLRRWAVPRQRAAGATEETRNASRRRGLETRGGEGEEAAAAEARASERVDAAAGMVGGGGLSWAGA